jgi:hypothetical protein
MLSRIMLFPYIVDLLTLACLLFFAVIPACNPAWSGVML